LENPKQGTKFLEENIRNFLPKSCGTFCGTLDKIIFVYYNVVKINGDD